ncbi:MAG: glutathionylspermidine synthase family protein [Chloroflexi bacterium]|nr:glutathionylspermidine synthase family protein [Chloroflexota bacterium]
MANMVHQARRKMVIWLISQLGWDGDESVDEQERRPKVAFKLYPWEWLTHEKFGQHLLTS